MLTYKNILVANGDLYRALNDKNDDAARKIYAATTERYNKTYSESDRLWFARASKDLNLVRNQKDDANNST